MRQSLETLQTAWLVADETGIDAAAALLTRGRLVAFGTETVYGLGADATQSDAIHAVFAAKGRPLHNPLIVHFADADAAFREVQETRLARALAEHFWPGPLTLVLPRRTGGLVCTLAGAGLPTLAVRVPGHPVALRLFEAVGRPIAAPSANPSGRVSPTEPAHVLDGLAGRIDAVLDCGSCQFGLESTVLALSGNAATLLRPGAIEIEAIEAALLRLGAAPLKLASAHDEARPASPGMLASHYAPRLPVRLAARAVTIDEGLLGFGPVLSGAGATWNLSETSDLAEAASRLFAGLRWLDLQSERLGLNRIAVMPIPAAGLGRAINDRLSRAATLWPAALWPGQS